MTDQTKSDSFCPDCCRDKAYNVESIQWGCCPKWWAVRDPDAAKDCERIAARIRALPPSATAQEAVAGALSVVRDAMEAAYNRCYPECCNRPVRDECCGNPAQAWDAADQKIMDALAPAERALNALLQSAAPPSPAVGRKDEDGKCSCEEGYLKAALPPQPVSETAAQGSVEFGEALDELIRANTAADADDRFGIERERRARANVERLYSLAAAPSAPFSPEAAALRSIVEGKGT